VLTNISCLGGFSPACHNEAIGSGERDGWTNIAGFETPSIRSSTGLMWRHFGSRGWISDFGVLIAYAFIYRYILFSETPNSISAILRH
jgi:hypothetical protein